jgi:putative glutamine amidotransferase
MLKIGFSLCYFHADPTRPIFKGKTLLYFEKSLCDWIQSQNALIWPIPPSPTDLPHLLPKYVQEIDGLVLQGGSDIAPETYGQTALRPEWKGDVVRDYYEIALLTECISQNKPIFGICRGAQLINVAFGGTLFQDLATQRPETSCHRDWDIYDQNFHPIQFQNRSRIQRLYPTLQTAITNSIHHQAIDRLGQGLQAEAVSIPDQIIEAIQLESPELYVYGIQWHPEFHSPQNPDVLDGIPLLKEFLKETQRRKEHRSCSSLSTPPTESSFSKSKKTLQNPSNSNWAEQKRL